MKWTARQIETALRRKYGTADPMAPWSLLREVTIDDVVALEERMAGMPPGYRPWGRPAGTFRRIDVLLMKTSPNAKPIPFERIAIEIKTSRADFLRETPEKRRAWQSVAHRFAYAAPRGLIARHEVPEGCGLLEVSTQEQRDEHRRATGRFIDEVQWRVNAPRRVGEPAAFDDRFVGYVVGRAARAEHRLWQLEER